MNAPFLERRLQLVAALCALACLWACSDSQAPGPQLCQHDEDCAAGQVCHQGVCRTECVTSEDCEGDQVCVSGVCLIRCTSDSDCPEGEECSSGYCRPVQGDQDGGSDGDGGGPECIDLDGDGFGENCLAGPDCNDGDDAINPDAVEICGDFRDNDCDDEVDETCECNLGSTRLCSSVGDPMELTDEMRCLPGHQMCEDGLWGQECIGEVGPFEEECNGLDDDCDGEVDEGLLNAVGLCDDGTPVPDEDCGPTGEGNGLDDNGDGQVDEGCSCAVPGYDPDLPREGQPCYSGPIYTLGVGECHGGTRDCGPDGLWDPCTDEVTPSDEVCGDLLDNDCDGFIDENCPSCSDPSDEVCDGVDNDCDGIVDEGVLNACGDCGEVADEDICGDGLDNDCDGAIDEGCGGCSGSGSRPCYPGSPSAAGAGICSMGTQQCDGEFWGECHDYVLPEVEICGPSGLGNGLDEDCDGEADDGCGCVEGAQRPCGACAGMCEYGRQICQDHEWGECTGGVGPELEECDGIDNDCDGLTDEGLLNACGTCGETCYMNPVDPTTQGEPDEGTEVIAGDDPENPTGRPGITLTKSSFIPPYLWAANHTHDSVTKFNMETEEEEGIYWVGANPSRTAVDLDGNMWVGGRNDGRLTKVIWDTTACPDSNGNSQVDTSRNEGGVVTMVNNAADPLADECVVYSAVPNLSRPSIRGIAAGPDGKMWIGYSGGGLQWIDPVTFEIGPFFPADGAPRWTPDANGVQQPVPGETSSAAGVYGLVVDSRGYLYTASYSRTTLPCFDTNTEQWVAVYEGLCGAYGIAVDAQNRIWVGSYPHCGGVGMFDPAQMRLYTFAVPNTVGPTPEETSGVDLLSGNVYAQVAGGAYGGAANFMTTGVGVEPDTGDVWISFYPIGYTGRLRVNEADYSQSQWTFIGTTRNADNSFLDGVGPDLRGVGFDRNGFAWTLGLGSDRVLKLDPATNERAASMPVGKSIGVGTHYTYSDFTGSTALSFTAPRGFWRYSFESEFDDAQVDAIAWEAYVPDGTTAGIRIRAMDRGGNPVSDWLPPDSMGVPEYFDYPTGQAQHRIDLSVNGGPLVGNSFEVEIRLTTNDRDVRPIVNEVLLEWQRP